jgi:Flp pilus assembly protein TadB
MQATVIGVMPFLLMLMMSYVVPDAMGEFFGSIIGIVSCIAAIILVAAGFFVIRKITTIKV